MPKVEYKKDGSLYKRQLDMLQRRGTAMFREGAHDWSASCIFSMSGHDAKIIGQVLMEYVASHK